MLKTIKPLATVAVAALSLNTHAAIDMFLKLDGIDGEAQDKTHAKQVDILAWSWGMSQSGTTHISDGGGAGKAAFADLSVTKWVDKSSVPLKKKLVTGEHIDEATLTMRKAGGSAFIFEQIVLYNILVSSVATGGSGGEDRLTENVTFNFEAFCVLYTEQTPQGDAGAKPRLCWNIAGNDTCSTAQLESLYSMPLVRSLPRDLMTGLNPVCADT